MKRANAGAIIKVELVVDAGASHTVFDGVDTAKYNEFDFWFRKSFDKTSYLVKGEK